MASRIDALMASLDEDEGAAAGVLHEVAAHEAAADGPDGGAAVEGDDGVAVEVGDDEELSMDDVAVDAEPAAPPPIAIPRRPPLPPVPSLRPPPRPPAVIPPVRPPAPPMAIPPVPPPVAAAAPAPAAPADAGDDAPEYDPVSDVAIPIDTVDLGEVSEVSGVVPLPEPPVPPPPPSSPPPPIELPIEHRLESPTAIERALGDLGEAAWEERAAELTRRLEIETDRERVADVAYELGELCERRLVDEARAVKAFGRALASDPSLRANLWAIRRVFYRRGLWPNLIKLIDAESRFAIDDDERADLAIEKAAVLADKLGQQDDARAALEDAVLLAPGSAPALLALERVADDPARQVELWAQLAEASARPERKLVYLLDQVRFWTERGGDLDRARELLVRAAELGVDRERVDRERLRLAELAGDREEMLLALDASAEHLLARAAAAGAPDPALSATSPGQAPGRAAALRLEVVAIRRRQAQLAQALGAGDRAWDYLQAAMAAAPGEPILLADLADLAEQLGRYDELAELVQSWQAVEGDPARGPGPVDPPRRRPPAGRPARPGAGGPRQPRGDRPRLGAGGGAARARRPRRRRSGRLGGGLAAGRRRRPPGRVPGRGRRARAGRGPRRVPRGGPRLGLRRRRRPRRPRCPGRPRRGPRAGPRRSGRPRGHRRAARAGRTDRPGRRAPGWAPRGRRPAGPALPHRGTGRRRAGGRSRPGRGRPRRSGPGLADRRRPRAARPR
jgi:tetratricopeptide (TPR) repeat protein